MDENHLIILVPKYMWNFKGSLQQKDLRLLYFLDLDKHISYFLSIK